MAKHVELAHKGEEPTFMLRVVKYHKSALSRQTAEAVRIRRRGGERAVLNSRAEFNRCFIPRLRLVGEEEITEREQLEEEEGARLREELQAAEENWAKGKSSTRNKMKGSRLGKPVTGRGAKSRRVDEEREQYGELGKPPRKRRKKFEHALMDENWGQEKTTLVKAKTTDGGDFEPVEEHDDTGRSKDHPDHAEDDQEPRVEEVGSQEHIILTPSLQERIPPTITGKYGGTSLITDYFQAD